MFIRSNFIRKMIVCHIGLLLVFLFLWSVLGLPWSAIYIFDLLVCVEFAWIFRDVQTVMKRIGFWHVIPYLLAFALYLLLTQIANVVSLPLMALAYRRVFRFYLFYFACAVLLNVDTVEKLLDFLVKLQPVNLLLTLFQYFVQRLGQDNLGGLFGVENGANAYSNIFLCIVCTHMVIRYLAKKEKLMPMLLTLGSSLIIAALAELKIFFVEIIIIILLAVLLSNPSARTVKIIAFGACGFVGALMLLGQLFPEHMAILLSLARLAEYTSEAIYGYRISRLGAFSDINQIFFKGDIARNLFGYGFGNCETGSAFYEKYEKYSYTWFTHQVTFLETGYIGVLLYLLFFVMVYIHATISKKANPENAHYYSFTQIICVLCAVWFVYNQALRMELGYLIFFALAIPAVVRNNWLKSGGLGAQEKEDGALWRRELQCR